MVVRFDLKEDGERLLTESIADLQRAKAPANCSVFRARRVLLVAESEDFPRYGEAVRRLRLASSVVPIICVLRAAPTEAGPDSGPEVVLPAILQDKRVAVIWVGDPRGTVWEVATGNSEAITNYPPDPDGEAALEELLSALEIPAVFDKVFEHAKANRCPVSPALRVFVPGSSAPGIVETAEAFALQELTGRGDADSRRARQKRPPTHPQIFDPAAPTADFFTPDGSIGLHKAKVERATEDAVAGIKSLRGDYLPSRSRRRDVAGKVLEIPNALDDLRNELIYLFEHFEPTDGINEEEWELIVRAGVTQKVYDGYDSQQEAGAEAADAVRTYAEEALRSTKALGPIMSHLRGLARKATPRTSKETVQAVKRTCPDERLDGLRRQSRFKLPSTVASLAALFGFGATLVWWPGILHVIPVLLLLAASALLGHAAADTDWPGWRAFFTALARILQSAEFVPRAAAFIGGLILGGIALDAVAGPSALVDEGGVPGLRVVCVVLSLVLLAAYVRLTWRAAVDAWVEDLKVESVTAAGRRALGGSESGGDEVLLDRILSTARDVIGNDWMSADVRREFKTIVERLLAALDRLRSEFAKLHEEKKEVCQRVRGVPAPAVNPAVRVELDPPTANAVEEFEDLVLEDYLDEIARALDRAWPLLRAKAAQDAEEQMRESLRDWQPRYSKMLGDFGLLGEGPRFEQETRDILSPEGFARRYRLLEKLWRGIRLDLLHDEQDLVQYCGSEHLRVLDQSETYRSVVFAPDRADPPEGVIRTPYMGRAGLIRVVDLAPAGWSYGPQIPPADAA
ncbi:MAG TPA: hypothetical protein VF712_18270 [Thermoleophilaceae bacterium]|jgi:hypothetical protein